MNRWGICKRLKLGHALPFPGRKGKYFSLEWHWWHFDAVDYNAYDGDANAVYLFKDKQFDDQVDLEKGWVSYLMGCDWARRKCEEN